MQISNLFDKSQSQTMIDRINVLTPSSQALRWSMTVDQMLAHLNVMYDMTYTEQYPAPGLIGKRLARAFAKKIVTGETPYEKNGRTAPEFIIKWKKDFEKEKKKLINYIIQTQELWESHFDQKENMTFGILSDHERNNLFSKHLDHHLRQFGV